MKIILVAAIVIMTALLALYVFSDTSSEQLYPKLHADTKIGATPLIQSEVDELADEDGNGIEVDKNDVLYAVLASTAETPTSLNSVNCSINFDSEATVSGGQYWEVLDAAGGNQVATEAIANGVETDVTYTLENLQDTGLAAAELNTMQVIIHGETAAGPGSMYIDWIRCDASYEYTAAAENTCTPPAVDNDWAWDFADNCNLTGSAINIGTGKVYVKNTNEGTWRIEVVITASVNSVLNGTTGQWVNGSSAGHLNFTVV